MIYQRKMIKSGNVIEVYNFGIPIRTGDDIQKSDSPPPINTTEDDSEAFGYIDDPRARALQRAKQKLRRLVNSNVNQYADEQGNKLRSKFLTLTFAEHITDLNLAHYEWEKFIKRLNYYLGDKHAHIKYSVVVEFTKIGRVHYHAILYNLPYIKAKTIESIWGQGFIKINRIDKANNAGAYVTKYMTKNHEKKEANQKDRLQKRRSHFSSMGLFEPVETVDENQIDQFLESHLDRLTFEKTYDTDFLGEMTIQQYIL